MSTIGRSGRLAARSAWLGLLLLAVASGLGCLGRVHWVLNAFSHFRPQYGIAAAVLLPAALFLGRRRWWFVLGLIVVMAFNQAFLLRVMLPPPPQAPRDTQSVSVLLWNTWRKNRDFAGVNAEIRRADADVVLLQETTSEVRTHLTDLDDIYRAFVSDDDAALTRTALRCPVYRVEEKALQALHLELEVGGRVVDLIATHLAAPRSGTLATLRRSQLAELTTWIKTRTAPVVVVGDLNATPWSYELVDLRRDCRLVDSMRGCGLQATWPFHNALTSLLRIPLDHCLHTREIVGFGRAVGDADGSNHRPLFVRIALAD